MDAKRLERTWCGLTAVFAPELMREAVFRALRQRRCYATTGARMLVNFSVDKLCMGGEGPVRRPATIQVKVAGTAPIEAVTIVRRNEDVYCESGAGLDVEVHWEDADVQPGDWYYVRIKQADGHYAWASPVWCTSVEPR